jgi:uncharacterized repeat protein (TIGR03803 family)
MPQAPAIVAPARTIVSSNGNSASFYEVLHSFGGSGDGSVPLAGLLKVKGKLYGTTLSGGGSGDGTIFSIRPSGTETVLHSFGGTEEDGTHPYAGLLNVKGTLYGTTSQRSRKRQRDRLLDYAFRHGDGAPPLRRHDI